MRNNLRLLAQLRTIASQPDLVRDVEPSLARLRRTGAAAKEAAEGLTAQEASFWAQKDIAVAAADAETAVLEYHGL